LQFDGETAIPQLILVTFPATNQFCAVPDATEMLVQLTGVEMVNASVEITVLFQSNCTRQAPGRAAGGAPAILMKY
jgi:hypothetical protein